MIPITCNAVGDIIAHALDEAHGAPAKYRAFNSELKSLHIVLASVARVAELTADPLLRDEIVREVDRCGKDVRQALERVAKFSALGRDRPVDSALPVRMKRQWYKLEWRFGWHGSVDTIRDELAAATQRLTSYLVISNADGIQNLGISITNQFDANTARICMLVMDQFAAVARRDIALSRTVYGNAAALRELQLASGHASPALPDSCGHALKGLDGSKAAAAALMCAAMFTSRSNETGPTTFALLLAAFTILMCSMTWDGRTMVSDVMYTQRNSITLHDAMGRRLVLPLELCATFELCHATLVNLFSRRSGHWVIDAHRYRIECKGRYGVLDRQNWVSTVRSGAEISMVVIVQALDVQAGSSDPIYCPVCVVPRELSDYSTTHEACLCSGCGRALRNGYIALKLSETVDNVAHVAHRSIEHIVNDRGRFPRHRPTPTFGTRRRFPSSTYNIRARTESPDGREHLFDTGNRSGLLLNTTQAQTHGFKRIHVVPPQKTLHNLYFPIDSLEDCCELQIAANNGDYALVAELLDLGEDVNASLPSGYTALHLASSNGHVRIVEMLLDHGAAIDAVALNDITPLARAVARRHTRTVALTRLFRL